MELKAAQRFASGQIGIEEALGDIVHEAAPALKKVTAWYQVKFRVERPEARADVVHALWKLLETWEPNRGTLRKRLSFLYQRSIDHGRQINLWRREKTQDQSRRWADPKCYGAYLEDMSDEDLGARGLYFDPSSKEDILDEADIYDLIPGSDQIKRDLLECLTQEGDVRRAVKQTARSHPSVKRREIKRKARELISHLQEVIARDYPDLVPQRKEGHEHGPDSDQERDQGTPRCGCRRGQEGCQDEGCEASGQEDGLEWLQALAQEDPREEELLEAFFDDFEEEAQR